MSSDLAVSEWARVGVWSWCRVDHGDEYELFAPDGANLGTFPSPEAAYVEFKRLTRSDRDADDEVGT